MPPDCICVRSLRAACASLLLVALVPAFVRAEDDAAGGYARVRPSLVKVWAFDAQGRPLDSGSGIVIVSNDARSLVLTAGHVIANAASVRIDVDRDRHDIPARVQQRGPRDLAVLAIDRGGFAAATFASRSHPAVEGNLIAVAGYVEHDELIGIVGQEPRLLYPGTVSSRPDNGAYLELENVHIEDGLSGGPVFDPENGDVLGMVTSRTSDQRGGFADSAALVVVPFLAANAIGFSERDAGLRLARAVAAPSAAPATPAPARPKVAAVTIPAAPRHLPAVVAAPPRSLALALANVPAVTTGPRVWEAADERPHRFVYYHLGCAIVLSLDIVDLNFSPPSSTDDAPAAKARLSLRVGRRVAPVAACANVAESAPLDSAYQAVAASYDGHHLTIRFRSTADGASNPDGALFPADVSLDADLDAAPVTAHVQLIDDDWDDTLDVIASRDP
jgi:S1-C subfamily serine protease